MRRPNSRDTIADLEVRLASSSTKKSRTFWERYLKGTIAFRGVPMGEIRRQLRTWWTSFDLGSLSLPERKRIALKLFEGQYAEDKLAGTLVLSEILLAEVDEQDIEQFARLFESGLIADWNTCDWFCVKVLGRVIARELPRRKIADRVAAWCAARSVWQRRASNIAFVNLAKRGDANFAGFTRLMLLTCQTTVRSRERFAQTGAGWLLRELAESERHAVLEFAETHLRDLSSEAIRYITERMARRTRQRLLGLHSAARAHRRRRQDAATPRGKTVRAVGAETC